MTGQPPLLVISPPDGKPNFLTGVVSIELPLRSQARDMTSAKFCVDPQMQPASWTPYGALYLGKDVRYFGAKTD